LRKPRVEDLEWKRIPIPPSRIKIVNYTREKPLVAFNPGALFKKGKLEIFPRLIFDYHLYVSSIGRFEVELDNIADSEEEFETEIILAPEELWEFRGCEDPRIIEIKEGYAILYTGFGYQARGNGFEPVVVQGFALLNSEFKPTRKGFIRILGRDEDYISPLKDSAFIEYGRRSPFLTRPEVGGVSAGWWGVLNLEDLTINAEDMKPVLFPEKWELKVGWSTNTVKIGFNEYLVGWHAIHKETNAYLNGFCLISDDGRLLAVSDYLLAPKLLWEKYGDRPHVIFGNGLVLVKDTLYWVGGVSDYAIGIYSIELDKILEKLKWIEG